MIDTPQGDALILWDSPGFGDSARLAKRLAQQGNPIGWFLSQVWDRFRDRAFWLSQQAVANVRDQADVVLYLVNASEAPEDAGYLAPEMAVLEWIGKPVIVLLNQTGRPRPRDEEDGGRGALAQCARQRVRWCARSSRSTRSRVAGCRRSRCCASSETSVPEAKRDAYGRLVAGVARPAARAVRRRDGCAGRADRTRRLRQRAVARRRPQGDAGGFRQGDRPSRQRHRRCQGQGEPRRSPRVSITISATAPID